MPKVHLVLKKYARSSNNNKNYRFISWLGLLCCDFSFAVSSKFKGSVNQWSIIVIGQYL